MVMSKKGDYTGCPLFFFAQRKKKKKKIDPSSGKAEAVLPHPFALVLKNLIASNRLASRYPS